MFTLQEYRYCEALEYKYILIFDHIYQNPFGTKGNKLSEVYKTIERAHQLTQRCQQYINEENGFTEGKYAKNRLKHYGYKDNLIITICTLTL